MFSLRNLQRTWAISRFLSKSGKPALLSTQEGLKYNIRKAEIDDKAKVLSLGADVPTVDRLPTFYEKFIKDPQRHCYVLERWGEVVAYSHAHVVDGGTTLAFHDVRLQHEGDDRDNFRFLLTHSTIKSVLNTYPDLENTTVVLSGLYDNMANLDAVFKVVGKQQYHAVRVTPDDFRNVSERSTRHQEHVTKRGSRHPAPSYLTPSEAITVATRVSGISSFFGGDRIILMGESYRPTQENFVRAKDLFQRSLVTFGNRRDLHALSFRNSYALTDKQIQTVDVFAKDTDLFLDHFRHQVGETLSEVGETDVPQHFFVQVPAVISDEEFVELCTSHIGVAKENVSPVCDYVLGEIPCKVFQQAAAAHLVSASE